MFGDYGYVGPNFELEKWIGMMGLSRSGVGPKTTILLEKMEMKKSIVGFSTYWKKTRSDCDGIVLRAHHHSPLLQEITSVEGKWSLEERLGKFGWLTRGIV